MLQIHERIKNERVRAGLSEEDMAKRLNIPRSTYQYWEENTPKIEKVLAVAKALNLPEDYFFVATDESLVVHTNGETEEIAFTPTVDKLAQALADQAKANRDQAEGYKTLAEAYKGMLDLFKDMRKEMARQDSQAIIEKHVKTLDERTGEMDFNLKRVFAGLQDTFRFQEESMEELRNLLLKKEPKKNPSSPGGGKTRDQIGDEAGKKNRTAE